MTPEEMNAIVEGIRSIGIFGCVVLVILVLLIRGPKLIEQIRELKTKKIEPKNLEKTMSLEIIAQGIQGMREQLDVFERLIIEIHDGNLQNISESSFNAVNIKDIRDDIAYMREKIVVIETIVKGLK